MVIKDERDRILLSCLASLDAEWQSCLTEWHLQGETWVLVQVLVTW